MPTSEWPLLATPRQPVYAATVVTATALEDFFCMSKQEASFSRCEWRPVDHLRQPVWQHYWGTTIFSRATTAFQFLLASRTSFLNASPVTNVFSGTTFPAA
jgi:hypothetical protein